MKHPLRLLIQKKFTLNEAFKRYYTVDRLLIDSSCPIKTEAQLAAYIFRRHGPGRFMVLAYQKGHEGFWNFWIGELSEHGFIRDTRQAREIHRLQAEMRHADDPDKRDEIEEEIEFERNLTHMERKYTRRGPVGLIKSRPGVLHDYQEF